MGAVDTIDDSGLDVLVSAQRRARAAGTEFILQDPHADLAHIVEQNGLPIDAPPARSLASPPADRPRRAFPSR